MSALLKLYAWLSGILVAFAASYLTAVLSAVVPPPKALLCKLGLGFCPAPKQIVFQATDMDRIVDRQDVGQGPGQNQIGMLHNRVDPNERRPNMVKYRIASEGPASYRLRVYYASPEKRPVEVHLNDERVVPQYLTESTGGGDNVHRDWSSPVTIRLRDGSNTLMFRRADVFPHLSKIELTEMR